MGRIVSAGIDAAAQTAVAGLNYKAQMKTNEMNNHIQDKVNTANRRLAEKQNQWNIDQWNRENAYNAPEQQVERLQDAGLSAAAAAQSIEGAGNAAPLESVDLANQQVGAPMQAPQIDPNAIPSLIGLGRELLAYRKEKAEAVLEEKRADNADRIILTPLDAQDAATQLQIQEYKYNEKANPYSLRRLQYDVKSAKNLTEIQRLTMKEQKINFKLAKQNYGFLKDWNNEKLREIGENINKLIAEAEKARQEKRESQSRENLNNAQASLVEEQGQLAEQQTKNAKKEGKSIDLKNDAQIVENALKKAGSPESAALRVGVMVENGLLPPYMVSRYLWHARDYVETGGRIFNGTSDQRAVFINDINPGIGKDYQLSGGARGMLRHAEEGFGIGLPSPYENRPKQVIK